MFVTCHINFWPLSNFVGASLEVTRTINNNKLHFTWRCSILLLKKRKGPWTGFLWWFWHIFKYFNSNNNLLSYLLFSKCFRGYSILVCIGVQVLFRGFIFHSSSRAWLALRSRARLALASVWPKNAEKLRLFGRSRPPQWN